MPGLTGPLKKMTAEADTPVTYYLPVGEARLPLNPLLGKPLQISYDGEIHCIACGRKTKKSFGQGYCYPCFRDLARCDICIVRPEKCHYEQGSCREPDWGEDHCMRTHVVYLSNTSGLKVGITRASQIPTRWIDQGAVQALPILQARNRRLSGLAEVVFKNHVADKTNWRALLKGHAESMDLAGQRDILMQSCSAELDGIRKDFGDDALQPFPAARTLQLEYPVLEHPDRITSLNLDKTPEISGTLLGIKGQYLILDCGVINIRKYAGYQVTVESQA